MFSVELCTPGQINKVVLSRVSMLAVRKTGCNCCSEGSTGGAALAEKGELLADLSQNMGGGVIAQSRLISCPNAAAVIAPRPLFIAS